MEFQSIRWLGLNQGTEYKTACVDPIIVGKGQQMRQKQEIIHLAVARFPQPCYSSTGEMKETWFVKPMMFLDLDPASVAKGVAS